MGTEFGSDCCCFGLIADVVVAVVYPLSDGSCWFFHDLFRGCVVEDVLESGVVSCVMEDL